jgi:thioredoxin-related protein
MRYLTFIWWLIISIAVNAFGAEFEKLSLQEALNKASQENKYVFFYMTAKWCGPCLKMQKEVFPNDTISQILKDHFVAIKYDYDSWAGEQLRKEYDIVALPAILIFNSEGKVVKRNARFLNSSQLISFIAVNKQESASSNTLSEYEQKLKEYIDTQLKPFKLEVGVRLGINRSQIISIEGDGKTGLRQLYSCQWRAADC